MTASVLGASALLALLLHGPGAAVVRDALALSVISAVNLPEVVAHLMRFRTSPNDPAEILNRLPIVVVPFDRDQAHGAGTRISLTLPAGLSLGDRTCLALARIRGWPALTADHAWLGIAMAAGVEVTMIR